MENSSKSRELSESETRNLLALTFLTGIANLFAALPIFAFYLVESAPTFLKGTFQSINSFYAENFQGSIDPEIAAILSSVILIFITSIPAFIFHIKLAIKRQEELKKTNQNHLG